MRARNQKLLPPSFAAFCLIAVSLALGTPRVNQIPGENTSPLEIHISPLHWEKDCLVIGLDRINHSLVPVFLTRMGPYFDIALDVSKDMSPNHGPMEWVNVRGVSDIVSWEADPLAPNSTSHENYCISPTVWVTNRTKQTHREILVRGKMRVSISYFAREDAWKKNRSWHDDQVRQSVPHDPWNPPEDIAPMESTAFGDIPCPNDTCKLDCGKAPLGFHGEHRAVPDALRFDEDWNERGRAVTAELAQKSPSPCRENTKQSSR